MIERGLLTAGIVIVIIGALGAIGEQASSYSNKLNCALAGQTKCENNATPQSNGDTSTKSDKKSPK